MQQLQEIMDAQIDAFQKNLEIKNFSAHTVKNYLSDLEQFRLFLKKYGLHEEDFQIEAKFHVEPRVIRAYLDSLFRRKLKRSTVTRKIAALRTFFRFLVREGRICSNPVETIQAPRAEKHIPAVLPIEEMFVLLDAEFSPGLLGIRNRAMIELLYSSGLRVSELTGLNMEDIDFDQGLVRVRGKGKKERIVPVGGPALSAMKKYIEKRLKIFKKDGRNKSEFPVFLGRTGLRISARSVGRILTSMFATAVSERKSVPTR